MITGQQDDVRVMTLREAVQHLEGGMSGARCGASREPVETAQQPKHTKDYTTTFTQMHFPRPAPHIIVLMGYGRTHVAHA